jgi:hypothetical protein
VIVRSSNKSSLQRVRTPDAHAAEALRSRKHKAALALRSSSPICRAKLLVNRKLPGMGSLRQTKQE